MTDIRKFLGIKIESPFWDEAYRKALDEPGIPEWLTPEFIDMLNEDYDVLPRTYGVISAALPYVTAVAELCLFAKTLYHVLDRRLPYSKTFTSFEMPRCEKNGENALGYSCVAVFPVLAHVHKTWQELTLRGLPKDVKRDSLRWVDFLFDEAIRKSAKTEYSLNCFKPYSVAIYVNSLIIGRLRFEICENSSYPVRILKSADGRLMPLMDGAMIHPSGHLLGTYGFEDGSDAYSANLYEGADFYEGYSVNPTTRLVEPRRIRLSKTEWKEVYKSGDSVLKVHIPYGGRLDKDTCRESYERADKIFKESYPEYSFTSFMLECWMLSPELCDILPPESNIISFRKPYTVYPVKNSAEDALLYVYGLENTKISDIDIEALPESNSLQRGVKSKLLSGRPIYEFGGYMPLQ